MRNPQRLNKSQALILAHAPSTGHASNFAHVPYCLSYGRDSTPCTLCPSRFYNEKALKAHILCHVREKVFQCNFCNYKTPAGIYLGLHVRKVHEKRTITCSFPGSSLITNTKANLNQHLKRHNPDPLTRLPFPCNFPACGHRAGDLYGLNQHVQITIQTVSKNSPSVCVQKHFTPKWVCIIMSDTLI